MNKWILDYIQCPQCQSHLELQQTNENNIWMGPKIKTKKKWLLSLIRGIKKLIRPIDNASITLKGRKIET